MPIVKYKDLEKYAYDLYVNTYDDEYHWVIIYSEPKNADPNFNDWYFEGMQGDFTDPILSTSVTRKFNKTVYDNYQNAFAAVPLLVSFIPMIMDTGGNCGSQASTMVIRALATDEVEPKDFLKVWFKEIQISLLVGVSLAVVNGIRIYIEYGNIFLSLTIGCTLIITAIVAKSIGCLLPIFAKQLRLDPAYMASPMITTMVDACSLVIFFNVALLLMNI